MIDGSVIKKALRIFINKYFIVTVAFIVWMAFFDSDNYINRKKLDHKLKTLQNEKSFFLDEISKDSILTVRLQNDSLALEKLARERFQMKRDKEDVFLIIDTTGDQRPR